MSKEGVEVKPGLEIPATELRFHYSRSSGPGGQNVNKVESRAELRFDIPASKALTDQEKARLREVLGGKLTDQGVLILTSQRFRDRERNVSDCREKLRELLAEALTPPKPRVPTRPTHASGERRLDEKGRRSDVKRLRSRGSDD